MNRMKNAMEVARSNDADVVHTVGHFVDVRETYIHLQGKTRVEPIKDFNVDKNLKLEGERQELLRFFMKDETTWSLGAKIFRREFLLNNDIFFSEGVNLGESVLFLVQCILLSETYVITPEICYYYRQSEEGLTRKNYALEDMAELFTCQAEGIKAIDDFFAAHGDIVTDKSLIDGTKKYFMRPIENIIERIGENTPDLWGAIDEDAKQVLEGRLLTNEWWRNYIFGGYYRHTKEREHHLLVQRVLKEQLDAADGFIDRIYQAPRIIVVASIYTLMLCTLLHRDWEKSIILCGGGIPKEVFNNMKEMGLICYAPEGGAFVAPRILETIARYAKRHNIPIFGNDDTPEATHFVKLNFTAVEDGMANYNYEHAMSRPEARRITPDGSVYVPFGFNEWVKHIILTGKGEIPEQVKDKVEIMNPQKLWDRKTPQEKELIYKLYKFPGKELKQMVRKGRDVILLTEYFSMIGVCTEEEEIGIYREMIDKYGAEHVIIKPHHQDARDYGKIFPGCMVLPKFFPIEIVKYTGLKVRKVLAVESSAAYNNFPKHVIENRSDLIRPYLDKYAAKLKTEATAPGGIAHASAQA